MIILYASYSKQLLIGSFQLLFGKMKKTDYVELVVYFEIASILNKLLKYVLQHKILWSNFDWTVVLFLNKINFEQHTLEFVQINLEE